MTLKYNTVGASLFCKTASSDLRFICSQNVILIAKIHRKMMMLVTKNLLIFQPYPAVYSNNNWHMRSQSRRNFFLSERVLHPASGLGYISRKRFHFLY